IYALAFSPDGKKLLWGDRDTKIKLWDIVTGDFCTFPGNMGYNAGVRFDHTGKRIASANWDGTVKFWDLQSDEVRTFRDLSDPMDVAFSPDGRFLAAATKSGARMWDLTRSQEPRAIELKGQRNAIAYFLTFSPDGRYLAAGSSNTIRLWEVETGEVR